jgi:hypothetical protein
MNTACIPRHRCVTLARIFLMNRWSSHLVANGGTTRNKRHLPAGNFPWCTHTSSYVLHSNRFLIASWYVELLQSHLWGRPSLPVVSSIPKEWKSLDRTSALLKVKKDTTCSHATHCAHSTGHISRFIEIINVHFAFRFIEYSTMLARTTVETLLHAFLTSASDEC